MVDATKAVIHRYADTSVKFDDARPSSLADMEAADQVRVLGARAADGRKITAERVVFGHFSTRALAIEKIDAASGVISVKDLQSNQKFTLTVSTGGAIRKIPAEMAAMFGGGAPGGGRPGMGGGGGQSGAPGGPSRAEPWAAGGRTARARVAADAVDAAWKTWWSGCPPLLWLISRKTIGSSGGRPHRRLRQGCRLQRAGRHRSLRLKGQSQRRR